LVSITASTFSPPQACLPVTSTIYNHQLNNNKDFKREVFTGQRRMHYRTRDRRLVYHQCLPGTLTERSRCRTMIQMCLRLVPSYSETSKTTQINTSQMNLPSCLMLKSLTWSPASSHRTSIQKHIRIAPMRLLVATRNDRDIWAYQNLDKNYEVLWMLQETNTLRWPYEHFWMNAEIRELFKNTLRRRVPRFDEVHILIHYYFLAMGLVNHFNPSRNALGDFEWAVKSFAQGASINSVPYYNFRYGSQKMRALQATPTSSATLLSATAVSATTS
jgi:hypothetical protein